MRSSSASLPLIILLSATPLLSACGGSSGSNGSENSPATAPAPAPAPAPPEVYVYQTPEAGNDQLPVAHLQDLGIPTSPFEAMMGVLASPDFASVDSVSVLKSGTLVFDENFKTSLDSQDNTVNHNDINLHSMQSVTKSFASAVVGIAITQGYLPDTDVNVLEAFPEFSPFSNVDERKQQMTLHDLLSMRAGIQWDEWSTPYGNPNNSWAQVAETLNWVKTLLFMPMDSEPGTTFIYNTAAPTAIMQLVENFTGIDDEVFIQEELFSPLGIDQVAWQISWSGELHAGGGLFISRRDMAKFGQLYLNGGDWQGQRIIAESWIEASTTGITTLDWGDNTKAYGLQWWTNQFSLNGTVINGYHAAGYGGQFIFVFEQLEAVVVFTGRDYNPGAQYRARTYQLLNDHILPALLESQ